MFRANTDCVEVCIQIQNITFSALFAFVYKVKHSTNGFKGWKVLSESPAYYWIMASAKLNHSQLIIVFFF